MGTLRAFLLALFVASLSPAAELKITLLATTDLRQSVPVRQSPACRWVLELALRTLEHEALAGAQTVTEQ